MLVFSQFYDRFARISLSCLLLASQRPIGASTQLQKFRPSSTLLGLENDRSCTDSQTTSSADHRSVSARSRCSRWWRSGLLIWSSELCTYCQLALADHRGNKHGPTLLRTVSQKLTPRLTAWQTVVVTLLYLYICRNFAKITELESPEPLANLYNRGYFRATWITTALDAGFWTAMKIKRKWLRDLASIVFSLHYMIAAEQADEKVRRIRAVLTVDHMRVSFNKSTTPYLSLLGRILRPKSASWPPRALEVARPPASTYKTPAKAWLYFDGSLSELQNHHKIVLDIPGGGFVAMSPRHNDDKLFAWAAKTRVPILSLDYGKAPEFPYPYALNECFDVYQSLIQSRGQCIGLGGESPLDIVVSGDSAGGNFAVGLTLMVLSLNAGNLSKNGRIPPPKGLVLVYPALDMNINSWMSDDQMALIQTQCKHKANRAFLRRKSEDYYKLAETPHPSDDNLLRFNEAHTRLAMSSMISYFNDRVLTPEMLRAMVLLYIGPNSRPDFSTDYLLSPLLAPESLLARFPKTYFITGERDPLVDDTVILAGRIRQAKLNDALSQKELGLLDSRAPFVERDHVCVALVPGVSHGFLQFVSIFPEAWRHVFRCANWINDLLLTQPAAFQSAARRDEPLSPAIRIGETKQSSFISLNGDVDFMARRMNGLTGSLLGGGNDGIATP